jgi:hypothetical protein
MLHLVWEEVAFSLCRDWLEARLRKMLQAACSADFAMIFVFDFVVIAEKIFFRIHPARSLDLSNGRRAKKKSFFLLLSALRLSCD